MRPETLTCILCEYFEISGKNILHDIERILKEVQNQKGILDILCFNNLKNICPLSYINFNINIIVQPSK